MRSVKLITVLSLTALPMAAFAASPEVYIQGVRYASISDYQKAKQAKAEEMKLLALKAEKGEKLPLTVKAFKEIKQPSGLKTVTVAPISTQTARTIEQAGFGHGIKVGVADFKQNWDNPMPKFTISSSELESRLKAVAGDRKEPVLVIAEPNKLRVMSLGHENSASKASQ